MFLFPPSHSFCNLSLFVVSVLLYPCHKVTAVFALGLLYPPPLFAHGPPISSLQLLLTFLSPSPLIIPKTSLKTHTKQSKVVFPLKYRIGMHVPQGR